eukprot:11178286-Lingulodinium_polyedra.AAC.1
MARDVGGSCARFAGSSQCGGPPEGSVAVPCTRGGRCAARVASSRQQSPWRASGGLVRFLQGGCIERLQRRNDVVVM